MMKYPNNKKTYVQKSVHSKLGMTLEEDINQTNTYYLQQGIANIHKKPTPVQVVSVNYPARNKAKITEAYYKTPSTTDYNGLYKGRYIDFDCKETKNKTSLPLSNIHIHQQQHLKDIHDKGGLAFLIVHFKQQNRYFLMPYTSLDPYFNGSMNGKSIPFDAFLKYGYEIPFTYQPRLDYLKIIDTLLKS